MAGPSATAPDALSGRDQPIDLSRLFGAVRRRRAWVVVPTLVALVGSILFVMLAAPRFTGVAKVLLENQESYFTRPEKAQNEPGATLRLRSSTAVKLPKRFTNPSTTMRGTPAVMRALRRRAAVLSES